MQNLDVFDMLGGCFFSIMLKIPRQSISSSIGFVLTIVYSKIILGQLLSSMDLFRAWVFCIYEVAQVVIVSENKNFMLKTLYIVTLCLKSFNNCQELAIVEFISSLYQYYLFKKKDNQMPLAQVIQSQLAKNSINSIARCIRLNPDMIIWI